MPTYEYRCPDGHDFEEFVPKISQASSELPCPVCGKPAARRISAGAGLVFKGSGFYITDYGKDGKKDQRDRDEKVKTAAAGKGEGEKGEAAKGEAAKGEAKNEAAKGDAKGEGAKSTATTEGAKGEAPKGQEKKAPVPAPAPKGGAKE